MTADFPIDPDAFPMSFIAMPGQSTIIASCNGQGHMPLKDFTEIAALLSSYDEELRDARRFPYLIDQLRQPEGASVLICCPNPDFEGAPEAIEVTDDWTGWQAMRFEGETLEECFQKALRYRGRVDATSGVIQKALSPDDPANTPDDNQ